MDLIYKTEWSEDMDWEHVAALAEYVDAYQAPQGAKIFEQGGLGKYLCLLVEGEVDVMMADSTGADKTLAAIETGKPFGEVSLIDGEPRSATAVARVDSKVLTLTQDEFRALSEKYPRLGAILLNKLAELMSHRLRQTSGMLVEYLEA
jgi:CRP-like cAMP-binding protein